ncbi:ferredoxin [Mycobacterium sp. 852002-51057_SCH5723018]|uniref:ferredoxin n=1 Tax=Mycobacterium sp. 852002-51057_SCH5723018 TaxID=1834094 RepID=UPI0007FDDE5F|nr:ferredoxin [Mycobacterium sp. 852002-51057_SCH5723018]OBG30100.1 ferredoxin [Mycobacterium sp. 852002-51057_SCH5723018]
MKIQIDRNRCEGHGQCAEQAPTLFTIDSEGELVYHRQGQEVPDGLVGPARAAIDSCPVAALKEVQPIKPA